MSKPLTKSQQAALRALLLATSDKFAEAVTMTEREPKMITFEQVKTSDYEIGLTKLIGKQVKEVHGYLTMEYDDILFKLTRIEFENGISLRCEGEHDIPYLVGYGTLPNFDDETLERIYDETND